ncbi:MAG: YceI family protein [Bacteroidia bacterium]
MKIKFGFLMMGALFFMASCGGGNSTKTANNETETENHEGHDHEGHDHGTEEVAAAETYTVDAEASNIRWEGGTAGVTVYSHFGDINVQEGMLEVTGEEITGGSFVVDMTSIDPKDDGYSEENTPADLVGHLSTGDFFLVEEHPTASFEITGMSEGAVMGNLTIRGNTNEETVNLETMDVAEDGTMTAKGTLTFDRQKYEVKWAHYLKDVILKDDIDLEITLVAKK